jgi:signal transduction histidine kinase
MAVSENAVEVKKISLREAWGALHTTRPFAETSFDALSGVAEVELVNAPTGAVLIEPGNPFRYYWVLIGGEIRADRPEQDGTCTTVGFARPGEGFAETPLLTGRKQSPFIIHAVQDSVLVRFSEQEFWSLMSCCPAVRAVILEDTAIRMKAYQVEALHREKLVSLGTLAAGLMHELNNPGSAARRAASQLRENLMRLQQVSLRNTARQKTPLQMECMSHLLNHAIKGCHAPALSSIEQSDAEEQMSEWLDRNQVENAWTIGPALVAIGFDRQELECARDAFADGEGFSDALNWLEALVSSVTLVCAIEESISRVSELVMAVKKFAYDERATSRSVDVHETLQSTLTILGHKLRTKQINVVKRFAAAPSTIQTKGSALSQVWTNLIDNAVDASPEKGDVEISTWTEPAPSENGKGAAPESLVVSIGDHGAGISPEVKPFIFEAFFTTKPQGSGTGLGLEIVHRIVTQKFGGTVDVETEPGNTRFIVRLPLNSVREPAAKSDN